MKLAGIEIGGTKLQIVAGDKNGNITDRKSFIIAAAEGAGTIRSLVERSLKEIGKVDGIGVGFGGPVDRQTGAIWTSYHVDGWTNFNLKNWLSDVLGTPVFVENDANVAALGEAVAGGGKSERVVFYVTVGSGVGGGLVIDKEIYHGAIPGEVEFGHVRLDTSGRTVQSSCAGWAVNEKIRIAAAKNPESLLASLAGNHSGVEAMALLPAINGKDTEAIRMFEETTSDLAFGLSHIVHLFHPDAIIIGGGLSLMGEPLRSAVEQKLNRFVMDAFRSGISVRLSSLKTDAVPVGALILAGQQLGVK